MGKVIVESKWLAPTSENELLSHFGSVNVANFFVLGVFLVGGAGYTLFGYHEYCVSCKIKMATVVKRAKNAA